MWRPRLGARAASRCEEAIERRRRLLRPEIGSPAQSIELLARVWSAAPAAYSEQSAARSRCGSRPARARCPGPRAWRDAGGAPSPGWRGTAPAARLRAVATGPARSPDACRCRHARRHVVRSARQGRSSSPVVRRRSSSAAASGGLIRLPCASSQLKLAQPNQLALGFDALGDHLEAQAVTEIDDGAGTMTSSLALCSTFCTKDWSIFSRCTGRRLT